MFTELPSIDLVCLFFQSAFPAYRHLELNAFDRYLGCGAVAAEITANVGEIVQLLTLVTPQSYIGF